MIGKLLALTDAHSLRAVLGTQNFSWDFIEMFAEKSHTLYKLLKKTCQWKRDPEQVEALKTLKEDLAKALTLVYPQVGSPFVIQLATRGSYGGHSITKTRGKN